MARGGGTNLLSTQSIENAVLDAHDYDASIKLGGTILRRQLKLLLKLRVWEGNLAPHKLQEAYVGGMMVGMPPSPELRLASDYDGHNPRPSAAAGGALYLSEEDLEATINLRRYMDPAPFAMVARTPLPRVYRLFNEIGARHLVVINDNMSPIGMVTRKDLDVPMMVESLLGHKGKGGSATTGAPINGPAGAKVSVERLRKASKEQYEMASDPPRAPTKEQYAGLRRASNPHIQPYPTPDMAEMMGDTVTPSELEMLQKKEKASGPADADASPGAGD